MTLAEALSADVQAHSGAWNFGPADQDARPVRFVVESLASHWGISRPWIQDTTTHSPEERLLRLDVSKAASELGWQCRLPIDVALQWVAEWYRGLHGGHDARELCHEQIRSYFGAAPQEKTA
jgi:CDP-glucose 4,6-dehydratase